MAFSTSNTPHPLEGLALRLQSLVASRDVEDLKRCLDGDRLPSLSREGDDPADVIWECISRVMQPRPDWLDLFADLTAKALSEVAKLLAMLLVQTDLLVVNSSSDTNSSSEANAQEYWQKNESYVYNNLRLASYLPSTASLNSALEQFEQTAVSIAFIISGRVPEALQTARIAQQIDSSLATRWLAQLQQALRQDTSLASGGSRAQVLHAWRALLWMPSVLDDDQPSTPLTQALRSIADHGDSPQTTRMLRLMLEVAADTRGGQPHVWRDFFSVPERWPETVQELAQDLWPIDGTADAALADKDYLVAWQRLFTSTQRLQVRKLLQKNDVGGLDRFWFDLYKQQPHERQTLTAILAVLRGVLSPEQFKPVTEQALRALIAAEQASNEVESVNFAEVRRAPFHLPRSHEQYQQVTKTLQQIELRIRQRAWDSADQFSKDLLAQQKQWNSGPQFLSKTAASIATLWQQAGRLQEALAWWKVATDHNDADSVPYCGAADALKALGRLDEALELYQQTAAQFPNDPVASNGAADTLKALGRLDQALALYQQTVEKFPNDPFPQCGAAETLKALGRVEEGMVIYQKTIEQFPNNTFVRCGAAETLKALGRLDEAIQLYQETIEKFPNDVVALCGAAETLKALGRLEESLALYQQTVQQFPNNTFALCGTADTLKALGRLDEALIIYQQAVERFPSDVVARNGLANLYRKRKRFTEARSLLTNQSIANDFFDEVVLALIDADEKQFSQALSRLQNLIHQTRTTSVERERLLRLTISVQLRAGQHATALEASAELQQKNGAAAAHLLLLHVQLLNHQQPAVLAPDRMYPAERDFFKQLKRYQYDKAELANNDELFELEYEMLLAA